MHEEGAEWDCAMEGAMNLLFVTPEGVLGAVGGSNRKTV